MLEISIDSADKVSKRGDGLNVGLKIGNPVNPMDYSHSPHFLSDFYGIFIKWVCWLLPNETGRAEPSFKGKIPSPGSCLWVGEHLLRTQRLTQLS